MTYIRTQTGYNIIKNILYFFGVYIRIWSKPISLTVTPLMTDSINYKLTVAHVNYSTPSFGMAVWPKFSEPVCIR
jgi:hypothetical protein